MEAHDQTCWEMFFLWIYGTLLIFYRNFNHSKAVVYGFCCLSTTSCGMQMISLFFESVVALYFAALITNRDSNFFIGIFFFVWFTLEISTTLPLIFFKV